MKGYIFLKPYRMYKKIEHIKHEIQKDFLRIGNIWFKKWYQKGMNGKNLNTSQV